MCEQRIYVNASDLAKFTGHNQFCTASEVRSCFWSGNNALAEELGISYVSKSQSKVEDVLSSCSHEEKAQLSATLDVTEAELPQALASKLVTPSLLETTNDSSQKALQAAARDLSLPPGHKLANAAEHDSRKKRGTVKEQSNVRETGLQFVNHGNKVLYVKRLFIWNNYEIKIKGMVDGIVQQTGEVVEVKERRNRLFHRVVDYEKVQLHCYMKLTNTKKALLRERFDEASLEYWVAFDDAFWEDCMTRLESFLDGCFEDQVINGS